MRSTSGVGSPPALASIGLTIPTVAVVSILLGQPLALGLGVKDMVLLALTLLVAFCLAWAAGCGSEPKTVMPTKKFEPPKEAPVNAGMKPKANE